MTNDNDELPLIILLWKDDDSRWHAELEGWRSGPGDIHSVVADARDVSDRRDIKLKVVKGTNLTGQEVLALIEANPWPECLLAQDAEKADGGPEDLDVSHCDMDGIDLSRQTIQEERHRYVESHGIEPPWYVPTTNSMCLAFINLSHAAFRRARLERADFTGAHLQSAIFAGADLTQATLEESDLEDAYLSGARLQGSIVRHSRLRETNFRDASLDGVDFRGAHLEGVDLFDVASAQGVRFYGARLDRTRMRREHLGVAIGDERAAKGLAPWPASPLTQQTFREAQEAYLALKNNFSQIGRHEDAAWAYIKQRQMEKASYFPTTAGGRWIRRATLGFIRAVKGRTARWFPSVALRFVYRLTAAIMHVMLLLGVCPPAVRKQVFGGRRYIWGPYEKIDRWRWLRNWAYELLTGYGERPALPVFWALAVVVAFAAGYAVAGNISPDFAGDPATAHGSHNVVDALTHSIGAFATIGFNTLEPLGWGARLLTAIESAVGIGLFALFIFTLGNRMSRS